MQTSKIKSVKRIGSLPTMDIEINNRSHTFFGNGLATSNSHSVEYSVISYWDGWLKYYYPLQFFASYLTFSADDKKKQIMEDILNRGVQIELPKFGISSSNRWKVSENKLIMPFSEIVGIGETSSHQIENAGKKKRSGFFGVPSVQVSPKIQKILNDIHAFDKKYQFSYKELKSIQNYFIYDICDLFFEQ